MNKNKLESPQHSSIRKVLRLGGPVIAGVGLLFMFVGFGSFFSTLGNFEFEFPRFFWCAFVGMPLLFVGTVMCGFGYLGALQRYVALESAPAAKDVVNDMGENIRPVVRELAEAVAEGVLKAQKEQQRKA